MGEEVTKIKVRIIINYGKEYIDDTLSSRMVNVRVQELKKELEYNGVKVAVFSIIDTT